MGRNNYGQISPPEALLEVIQLVAGREHSIALQKDGTVMAWGRNDSNQSNVRKVWRTSHRSQRLTFIHWPSKEMGPSWHGEVISTGKLMSLKDLMAL